MLLGKKMERQKNVDNSIKIKAREETEMELINARDVPFPFPSYIPVKLQAVSNWYIRGFFLYLRKKSWKNEKREIVYFICIEGAEIKFGHDIETILLVIELKYTRER